MSPYVGPHLCESARPGRVAAIMKFGFTLRQARFLAHVLVYSGVFLERQYCSFAGIVHGQKTHDFLAKLVNDGYARTITPGALHRGRLFHVQYKPLYEAIGEPDNRNRKPATLGRFVERLMLLDAVLADEHCSWLGTEGDKMNYFVAYLENMPKDWYPHLTFGEGQAKTTRYFPDKLPIGTPRDGRRRHVFLYLVTREVPSEFRLFLLRHAALLRAVNEWTIRLLIPRRLRKAAALYRYAVRDAFGTPPTPEQVDELEWFFRACQGDVTDPPPYPGLTLTSAKQKFGAARFRALHRRWECEGAPALWSAQSVILRDQMERGWGRIECAELSHQYLQLTPLVGIS